MSDLRKERVGITYIARMLNVSVTEIKEALHPGTPLRGHTLPKPIARGQGSTGTQVSFYLGDEIDLADRMNGR